MKPKNNVSSCPDQELTTSKLRSYAGFENVSDEEAEKYIAIIKKFARILFGVYRNEQKNLSQI